LKSPRVITVFNILFLSVWDCILTVYSTHIKSIGAAEVNPLMSPLLEMGWPFWMYKIIMPVIMILLVVKTEKDELYIKNLLEMIVTLYTCVIFGCFVQILMNYR
jgi:hypothetical protein